MIVIKNILKKQIEQELKKLGNKHKIVVKN
jgi:hypothetical protein